MNYSNFLQHKTASTLSSGFDVDIYSLHPEMFDYQRDMVKWALLKGRSAFFAECGLGKTFMQLEWCKQVYLHTGKKPLILAPLFVVQQTKKEAEHFGISQDYFDITNYEQLKNIDTSIYSGICLDESSILKGLDGKTKAMIIERFADTSFKLACSATPAPNDFMELGNHAEFLGLMSHVEMLATFFVHDGEETSKWRLKGHAVKRFWEWVSGWAIVMRSPRDYNYDGEHHDLPPLNIYHDCVHIAPTIESGLFGDSAVGLKEASVLKKAGISERMAKAADLALQWQGQSVIWVYQNEEASQLSKLLPDSVEISGADDDEEKLHKLNLFQSGGARQLITKPKIAAWGMNWQFCDKVIFASVGHSFEMYYQAVRRCWRYGQKKPVNVHLVYSNLEKPIVANLERKIQQHNEVQERIISITKNITFENLRGVKKMSDTYKENVQTGEGFKAYLGDSCEVMQSFPDKSLDFSIFSPPFASLYTYSNSDRDLGNCKSGDDFINHFRFIVKELHRTLKDGRLVSFHCMNLPSSKQNDGFIGIKDFRGELIRLFQECGFIYHSEVCIWKDPVIAMQRTKAIGLLYKQLRKDSSISRQGIADYLVTMRKDGVNPEPITKTHESFPVHLWQQYASPVWMDINPSDTLQHESAREDDDERHICPLQLSVIRRAIELWSNKGDAVFSPFMGIGSEGYVAIQDQRKFIGIELKESYYKQACLNLQSAKSKNMDLFDESASA